ncbi:alpha-1,3-mannosyl-glycoprotein 4-beta-N-acetylglucosaminyltransferase B-like [Salarias fasciatus]|uniref:Alpha-1,3-mannosyl-glycoprotein 4-beta-N-acetylglucosaminyltransferase B-like n=1 Tax=Salarias fasciatus TaxID=181472 RepID=A0A672GQC8_SALFA|nr:alpha-1,3-mannosyl-glycoprotein 4-beta-N-acetylglucosaminyltransferase B-like [Salarias fasciatus]
MRLHPVRCGVLLLALGCFLSLTWISSLPANGGPPGVSDLQILHQRLLVAEELGVRVSRDLSIIQEQMRNSSSNGSHVEPDSEKQQTFLQSNIYLYMPHLREHPGSLVPNVVLGQGRRGVSIVLGIPTVKREKQSYLLNTVSSLLYSLTDPQRSDLLIIVFVAETDSDYVAGVADSISRSFPREVQSGLLEVVSPSAHYYPDFSTLRETFGDSKDRVKWRTKQNLDFSFLMLYAQDKGTYYVQLEDDVVAKADYYSSMKTYASQEESKQWLFLEFSLLGFIGKMFRTRDLPMIAEFFLMFHRDKPIDWLLDHILWVKVCNPERDVKDCARQKASMKRTYKPSLFQHVGLHSSLPGKVQQLKDKDFGKQTLHVPHSNPPAAVSSSLKHYQQHSLQRLYAGDDFFWALTPIQGDHVLISFSQDTHVTGFLFRSGNIETSGDKFYNTTVEVLPSNAVAKEQIPSRYKQSDDGFIVIGAFENGVAEGPVDEALLPLSALRLVVHSDSDVWALLSEVHIKL